MKALAKLFGMCFAVLFAIGLVIAYWWVFVILLIIAAIWFFWNKHRSESTTTYTNKSRLKSRQTVSHVNVRELNQHKENNATVNPVNGSIKSAILSDTEATQQDNAYADPYENIKLESNLYLGDILFLDWLDGTEINRHVPGYLVNNFNINPLQEKRKLKKDNYVEMASPQRSLNGLKVSDLKDILRDAGKKVSGRKKELIERIWNDVPEKYYMDKLPKIYQLSSKGEKLLDKYSLILWAHQNDQLIPLKQYVPYINYGKSPVLIAIALQENALQERLTKKIKQNYFPFSRYEESLSNLYKEEGNDDLAIQHQLNAAFSDYLMVGEIYDNLAFAPHVWSSQRIQAQIIDLSQDFQLSNEIIKKDAMSFYNAYSQQLVHFTKSVENQLATSVDEATKLTPEEFHQRRLSYLSKHIKLQQI